MGDFFISATELKARLEGGAPVRILDVRKRPAFEESGEMIPGAEWRDPAEIGTWIGDLNPGTPLVVHCVHGHEVSQAAGQTLCDAGFDARVLAGGFEAWREAGGKVVPAQDTDTAS